MLGPGFGFQFADSGAMNPSPAPDGAQQHDLVEDKQAVRAGINAVVVDFLPWVISGLFHLALVVSAVFIVWSTTRQMEQEKFIIPIARLSDTPGTPLAMTTPQQLTQTASSSRRTASLLTTRNTSPLETRTITPTGEIGIRGSGSMESSAGPFGVGPQPVEGFSVGQFFGTGGNARTIAYVIDASGSLIDTMPFVIDELKRSLGQLRDEQKFTVIFFQDGKPLEVPVPNIGMKVASAENKQKVLAWVDLSAGNVMPSGQTNPIKAVEKALQYNPELMFLLSDNIVGRGRYGLQPKELIDQIAKVNTKPTKINTIQFVYPDPMTKIGQKATLQRISEQTGGIYKFVDEGDLGTR